jgi:transketolase
VARAGPLHLGKGLYAVLAHGGYVPLEEIQRFRQRGSGLHGHPIQGTFPGVEMTSGSLGQGLSFGPGHVLAWRQSFLENVPDHRAVMEMW